MTLQQFSHRDLARAKKKINDVIFELEMEILRGVHNLEPRVLCTITAFSRMILIRAISLIIMRTTMMMMAVMEVMPMMVLHQGVKMAYE